MPRDEQVLTLTDEALSAILDIRSREPDAEVLALSLSITGVRGVEFTYELTFMPSEDATDDDALFTIEN
ncbi:MAG: hypothetical protein GWN79_25090, partial [Actinobacteria bacterium]|nr:hypothetical protein [Actinomycetota bacterium]NIS36069.1 hypothetical protein [Actinomycetota bacterium]NIU22126.1 hypothetical protein [Actinomycetota bacterium]NIU70644.1 hypothetical protein [Actinomycetota bacterium]NIV90248.1 hypothetical protein [Actinomycetota bacterium]